MTQPLRVLLVEDSEDDALLLARELRRGGFEPLCRRVDTAVEMRAALQEGEWDVLIADYALPRFSAPDALKLLQVHAPDTPAIIVSGSIDEDTAVRIMKSGANDYVMKSNLARLAPAVERELREAAVRGERRRAREEQARALSLLTATLESTADGILVVDLQGRVTSYNRKYVEMWRIPEPLLAEQSDDGLLGFAADQVTAPESFLRRIRELYADPQASSYDLVEFLDGRVFERYSQPQRIDGAAVGRVWSFRDITESKRLEEQLLQARKMESIGRLAGGVAHDFNNLLTAVMGYAELIRMRLKPDDPIQSDLHEIEHAAERAANLTRQLLAFARRQIIEPRVLDLNHLLLDVQRLLHRLISEDIELDVRPGTNVGLVRVDPGQLEQVLVNLAVNARDAMPEGGRLTIETTHVTLTASETQPYMETEPGEYVLTTVADTGQGMTEDVRLRVFEPFFTTKEPGKGTGLGLATCYGIIKQSGGHIVAFSAPGAGTRFDIYLPRVDAEAPRRVPSAASPRLSGTETLLLAEDEPGVRAIAANTLRTHGYTVLEAIDGMDALAVARRHTAPIHLLLTDVVMPQMGGRELSERLRADRPEMGLLFMSGYTDDAIVYHGAAGPGNAFLQKPFTPAVLLERVRAALDKDERREIE